MRRVHIVRIHPITNPGSRNWGTSLRPGENPHSKSRNLLGSNKQQMKEKRQRKEASSKYTEKHNKPAWVESPDSRFFADRACPRQKLAQAMIMIMMIISIIISSSSSSITTITITITITTIEISSSRPAAGNPPRAGGALPGLTRVHVKCMYKNGCPYRGAFCSERPP